MSRNGAAISRTTSDGVRRATPAIAGANSANRRTPSSDTCRGRPSGRRSPSCGPRAGGRGGEGHRQHDCDPLSKPPPDGQQARATAPSDHWTITRIEFPAIPAEATTMKGTPYRMASAKMVLSGVQSEDGD